MRSVGHGSWLSHIDTGMRSFSSEQGPGLSSKCSAEEASCGVVGSASLRLPVVVRFPAGPQVSLKCGDQSKDNGAGHKKKSKCSAEVQDRQLVSAVLRSSVR